ncbi:MAG: prolyl oligopeptidase family serine peptidase, partial [Longimicrobiales bacterium]|nr:prolyl oligopeptidase family serine peptidase [Longimicrobiales bacterium]
ARLAELVDRDDVGGVRTVGDHQYFSMRRQGEPLERWYRRPVPEGDDPPDPTVDGTYEVFLDPADFDPDHRVQVDLRSASPDERYLMYAVRQGGADEVEIRIRDLETGEDLQDRLPDGLYGGIEWDDDSRGFTYVDRDRYEGPRLKHHALGTSLEDDPVLWGEGYGPETFIGRSDLEDGRWRLYSVQHGWASNDWFIEDVRSGGALRPVTEDIDAHVRVRYRDGRLWILTDWEASNYRLMTADPRNPEPEAWTELIPEAEDGVLQGYDVLDGRIYATYLVDVADRIRVFELDGTPGGELPAVEMSSMDVGLDDDGELELRSRGYLRPSRTWSVERDGGALEDAALAPVEPDDEPVPFDTTGTVVRKLWYTSADGTRAPVHVMHRAGIEMDGSHPTILSGYGGFTSNIKPGFSSTRAAWVEMGGVWAVATLRGGNEYGEDWHRDGMLTNKPNVFADFIAAAEELIAQGYTSPEHLGISGGSNGGLLVASAMTARPDLFRAVLCTYPDLDMLRFWAFQDSNNMPALLEYGDARIPEHFEVMRTYSPYQAVTDGVEYPAVMLTTGDLDTRVPPLQARKMTARLQAATASGLPVVLWYDEMGGHAAGRGRPMELRIEDTARELTFMAQMLGLEWEEE